MSNNGKERRKNRAVAGVGRSAGEFGEAGSLEAGLVVQIAGSGVEFSWLAGWHELTMYRRGLDEIDERTEMMRIWRWWFLALAGPGVGWATDVGDPAPGLTVGEWVKGEPFQVRDAGTNVVVVDFWASWSSICRTTMPKLSRLQSTFRDRGLVVVGIADENPRGVRHYVEKVGKDLDYAVGVDVAHRTFRDYMVPFKTGGVPHSFIIDREGKVVWHGHPMRGLEEALEQVISGEFDMEDARRKSSREKRAQEYLVKAREGESGKALTAIGRVAIGDMEGCPEALNHFAWMILTDDRIERRDNDLALMAAKAAYEATSGEVAAIVDTYARALFEEGNIDSAVAMQRKARDRADGELLKARYEATLARYTEKLEETVVNLAK